MGIFDNFRKEKDKAPSQASAVQSYKIGDRIAGRYEIQHIFGGEGKTGMGIVYVCYDHEFREILALKTFQERFFHSKKIKDNFKKEALAWIHLEKHPHIVRAHWVQELDNRIFVACEYITSDGEGRSTLTDHLKYPLSLSQVLAWSIQLCYGMEYACSRGVTPHRDIKPDNIMITLDGTLKITDFGFAGLWDKADITDELKGLAGQDRSDFTFLKITNQKIIAGTPSWMAPEQFHGVANVWSDIYSFGIIMYQMLNRGELPFKPNKGDSWENAHKTCPVPALKGHSKAMSLIIEKCTQKRREKRYKDFQELRGDLEAVFKKEVTKVTGEKPPEPPELDELKEREIVNKGVSLANLGLVDEAIKKYRDGLGINPKNAAARNNLGNALAQKGNLDGAIREYKEALKCDPDYAMAYYNLGMALFKKGIVDDAIKEYRNALRKDPQFVEAYMSLAAAFIKKGLLDETIKSYKGAIEINPYYAEAYHNLGVAFFKKGLKDEAISSYKESLKLKPDYAEAYQNLGTALFQKGLLDESISAYRNALKIKPQYIEANYNLGIALLKKESFSDAINAFESFIKYAPAQDSRVKKAEELIGKIRNKLKSVFLH